MKFMTRPWEKIIEHYDDAPSASIAALRDVAIRIKNSELSNGLHAWTSMWDLCIVQNQVTYPYDGPQLRIAVADEDTLEFRYFDSMNPSKQWSRTVPAREAWSRLISFLDQLHWFVNLEEFLGSSHNDINN